MKASSQFFPVVASAFSFHALTVLNG